MPSIVCLSLFLFSVWSFTHGAEYTICVPEGRDSSFCNLTLPDIVMDSEKYFASNTILTFLPGNHMLHDRGPIVISDVSNLTLQGAGELRDGFHWTLKESNVIINCTLSRIGGFVFNRSSVDISLITFTDCGLPVDSTYQYLKKRYSPFQNGLFSLAYNFHFYTNLWSTIYFIDSPEVSLSQMSVQNCFGSCLYFLNTENVSMIDVYIAHNEPKLFTECCEIPLNVSNRKCIGGNAIFFYLSSLDCSTESTAYLMVQDSSFSFGAGPYAYESVLAGVTIVNLRNTSLFASFDSTMFYGNSGGNFGSITVDSTYTFSNISSENANVYLCPSSTLGIAFKVSVTNENLCKVESNFGRAYVSINNSYFANNTAVDSAGFNIDTSYVVTLIPRYAEIVFYVANSRIVRNRAIIASCIGSGGVPQYHGITKFFLENVTMTDNIEYKSNRPPPYIGIPASCIVLINTYTAYFKNVVMSNHQFVGIASLSSNLEFEEEVLISNHTGIKGGGIFLETTTTVTLLPNTVLKFIDNKAEFGAAMYITEPEIRAYIYLDSQLCFYQILGNPDTSNARFHFSGNEASITGNVVFGGFINSCLLFYNSTVHLSSNSFPVLFDINPTNQFMDISSDAVSLCFCDDNGTLYCNETFRNTSSVFPGQIVEVNVVPIGQLSGITIGEIKIGFDFLNFTYSDILNNTNATCLIASLPVKLSREHSFEFKELLSKDLKVNFTLSLEMPAAQLAAPRVLTVSVPVNQCPPGFSVNSSFICQCDPILLTNKNNVTCDIARDTLSHGGNMWIGYSSSKGVLFAEEGCPFDYCIRKPVTFNILTEPDAQCAYNRSGILCGGCTEGYSLLLGSNECGECPNDNYLSLLLVFGVAGILLVVLLILLNLTVSVGTINGLIFYANIVKINESFFFPDGPIPFLSNFIAFLNLDFGFKTCFYEGMTSYAKVWLQYVFPLYIWVIILVIIVVAKYSVKLSKLVGSNAVPVLATLVLLTYTKLMRTYTLVFKEADIVQQNGGEIKVWAVDAAIKVYSFEHLTLLAFSAIVFLFFNIPFTIFVIVVPLFEQHLSSKCGLLWLQFLKPVNDAYSGPFKDTRRYWVGFGLVARIIVVIVVSLVEDATISVLVVFFVVLFLLSLFALFGGYYKHQYLNYLEVWTNLNLLAITVLALGNKAIIGTCLTASLIFLTFVGIVIFHIVTRFTQRSRKRKVKISASISTNSKMEDSFNAEEYKTNRVNTVSELNIDYDDYDNRFRESLIEYVDDN